MLLFLIMFLWSEISQVFLPVGCVAALVCGRFWQSLQTTHSRPFRHSSRSKNTVTLSLVAVVWMPITFWPVNHLQCPLPFFSPTELWDKNYTWEALLLRGQWRVHRQHQSHVSYVVISMTSAVTTMCRCVGLSKGWVQHKWSKYKSQQKKRTKIRP